MYHLIFISEILIKLIKRHFVIGTCAEWDNCEPQCLCAAGMTENEQGECVPVNQCGCEDDDGVMRPHNYTTTDPSTCTQW